ncbi:hypothetical protein JVT61DRAFT_3431 [Boletus reticuloceps]|uniref:Uncharacterized protein n=1 Tax=Boletus reticuloceps TaxID=495285 RepID=A0A8I3A7Y7_9AGAM|nr:hypothetical protein JVT61DRAFT_3431 [Boletus reticuloceps]
MTLPCIAFQLPRFASSRTRSGRVYRADTIAFGMVEIRTRYDLSRMRSLYLIHPWLDSLIEHGGAFTEDDVLPPPSPSTDDEDISGDELDNEDIDDDSSSLSEPELPSIPTPAQRAPVDRETRARELVARLRQPFGALLLTVDSTGRRDGAVDYKRVAADSLITVQLQESVSLADILDNVRVLEVL